jgi:hypothetical protein
MSDEAVQLIAAAVVTLAQLYVIEPWKYPVFAYWWDWIAKICGNLAKILADVAMRARLNYFTVVNSYGD